MKLYDCLVAEECREKYKNAENSKHMNVFFFFPQEPNKGV